MIFSKATETGTAIVPQDSEAIRLIETMKQGESLEFTKSPKKTLASHKGIHGLLQWTYHTQVDLTPIKLKGQTVEYLYDRFVYDILMQAGFYTLSRNLRGEIRPIAIKLTYNHLSNKKAIEVYNRIIQLIQAKYVKKQISIEDLELEYKSWRKVSVQTKAK